MMKQKRSRLYLQSIRKLCRVVVILFLGIVCFSCKEKNDNKQSVTNDVILGKVFAIEDYTDSIIDKGEGAIISSKLKQFFNEKRKYFIDGGGAIINKNIGYSVLIGTDETAYYDLNKGPFMRYLLIDKQEVLIDTLSVKNDFEFSICQFAKDSTEPSIAVGKYKINGGNEYFEIYELYSIDREGKIIKKRLDTVIYDCPAPNDYSGSEEPDLYEFGVVGQKRYTRGWYENITEVKYETNLKDKRWFGEYEAIITPEDYGTEPTSESYIGLVIKKDSIVFSVGGNIGSTKYYLLKTETYTENEVKFIYDRMLIKDGLEDEEIENVIGKYMGALSFDGKNYYLQCPRINSRFYQKKDNKIRIEKS